MRIFRISFMVNQFQNLLPADKGIYRSDMLDFECRPKLDNWVPPLMYSTNPLRPAPDFWSLGSVKAITASPHAMNYVQTHFEMAGEILPLPFDGQELAVLNVLEVYNALDPEKTKWLYGPSGKRLIPKTFEKGSYHFFKDRFGESSIFKIPETYRGEILCWERQGDPETEFKAAVEHHGLTGIEFQLLWDSDAS